MATIRANCFDASALVKVYVDEPCSPLVRDYFNHRSATKYSTPFCFYEALNILKSKWKYQGKIDESRYRHACFSLVAWYGASSRHVRDVELTAPETLGEVLRLTEKHGLDVSDAFQLHSVKAGYFSHLVNRSKTLLVTADVALAEAARAEDILVWDVLSEPEP